MDDVVDPQDTVGYEVVKLINHQGALAIERAAQAVLVARRFPKGGVLTLQNQRWINSFMAAIPIAAREWCW